MSRDQANAAQFPIHYWESIELIFLENRAKTAQFTLVIEAYSWHGHDLLSGDELIAHRNRFIQKGKVLASYSSNVHAFVENTANCKTNKQSGDNWQEEVDIFGGLEHNDCQAETESTIAS